MRTLTLLAAAATVAMIPVAANAGSVLTSANGTTRIGVSDGGQLNFTGIGIGYNFTGQGGRFGFQDALSPGCECESWGIAANNGMADFGGQIGNSSGNQNIIVNAPSSGMGTFSSFTELSGLAGLSIEHTVSQSVQTATGALFQVSVKITNGTGVDLSNVRYARAMDWDVPPTEFNELVTHVGTGTTASLIRSTDDGFANANPLTAVFNTGLVAGSVDTDFTDLGPSDHGSLFVFDFGSLAVDEEFTFNIFYGAGANERDALTLLSLISPELFSLGQSAGSGSAGMPTYIFAFNGVGGEIVIPPIDTPEPGMLGMLGLGVLGLGLARRRRGK